jgi:NADPH:quinone reductase-like Zn-dependent oxidoreductase
MAETKDLRASKLFCSKDDVCLVTGGGSGIGLMAAQALAANGTFFSSIETDFTILQIFPRCQSVHHWSE